MKKSSMLKQLFNFDFPLACYTPNEKRQEDIKLWLEPLVKKILQFATFNACQSIKFTQVKPPGLADAFKQGFEGIKL